MPIVNDEIRDLVGAIEDGRATGSCLDADLQRLVARLQAACAQPEVQRRYADYSAYCGALGRLPVDEDGFIIGYDPLTQEDAFFDAWLRYGIVASPNAVCPLTFSAAISRIESMLRTASDGGCDLQRPETWRNMPVDEAGVPLLSRGFFEIYHDRMLARLRQSLRIYLHHVLIWGQAELWTTFDRLGIKLPGHEESAALPLHVDQNPNVHPHFRTVQGVLALTDCPRERGTYVGVPGSKSHFVEYGKMARNNGEYVELDLQAAVAAELQDSAQICPLRAGTLISWDSRTTHANSLNESAETRIVAYVAAGLAREDDGGAVAARLDAFNTGLGSNVRTALMHASRKPRFTSCATVARVRIAEQLTLLGRLLYGQSSYREIEPETAP
jgi:hypothetical protein